MSRWHTKCHEEDKEEGDGSQGSAHEEAMNDPLGYFTRWEGQSLGDDHDDAPGFVGTFKAPSTHLHVAHGWATSSARQDGAGNIIPAVYVKLAAGAIGTGPAYHVLEGIIDADIARELGEALILCAERARLDAETDSRLRGTLGS